VAAFDLAMESRGEASGYFHPAGRRLQSRALARGVFLRPLGDVVYLLPPLGISDAQLSRCYGAIRESLQEI